MILDKLMEKKDLIHYINFRIYKLTHDFDIKKYPPEKREYQRQRITGRVRELKTLKAVRMSGKADKNVIFELSGILSDMPTDEEIQHKHDQQIRAQVLEEVYKRLEGVCTEYQYAPVVHFSAIEDLFDELKGESK